MAEVVRIELESGALVCEHCQLAKTVLTRLRGLLGRSELNADEGIWLQPCASVHTFFMRFPIDVVFCDADLRVLSVAPEVPRWRLRSWRGARIAIELAAGEAARRGVTTGAQLRVVR